jgi:hypothetical protein
LVSDSTLSVESEAGPESHRSFEFVSDHRSWITVRTEDGQFDQVQFRTDSGTAYDIELWHGSDPAQAQATAPKEPAEFGAVARGPIRVVYSLPDIPGRFQTEWVLLP